MKKKIFALLLAVCTILPCAFVMPACEDGLTDCAYVQFVPAVDGEVVQYTSRMYAGADVSHIYLFASEEIRDLGDWENNSMLKISFKRGFGVDYEIDDIDTLVVDIEDWSNMDIRIKKEYYDSSKKVYLNGEDITSKAISTLSSAPAEITTQFGSFWTEGNYYFEDFGLVKGNKSEFINTIEYK